MTVQEYLNSKPTIFSHDKTFDDWVKDNLYYKKIDMPSNTYIHNSFVTGLLQNAQTHVLYVELMKNGSTFKLQMSDVFNFLSSGIMRAYQVI